jgi:hypothetical protein
MIHSRDEEEATANRAPAQGGIELERLLADGNTAQKIAKRARIVLMSGDGHGVMAIMREVGDSKTTVWRWQGYFVEAGVEGLVKGQRMPAAPHGGRISGVPQEDRPRDACPFRSPSRHFEVPQGSDLSSTPHCSRQSIIGKFDSIRYRPRKNVRP